MQLFALLPTSVHRPSIRARCRGRVVEEQDPKSLMKMEMMALNTQVIVIFFFWGGPTAFLSLWPTSCTARYNLYLMFFPFFISFSLLFLRVGQGEIFYEKKISQIFVSHLCVKIFSFGCMLKPYLIESLTIYSHSFFALYTRECFQTLVVRNAWGIGGSFSVHSNMLSPTNFMLLVGMI
jgi:hypothetical protein